MAVAHAAADRVLRVQCSTISPAGNFPQVPSLPTPLRGRTAVRCTISVFRPSIPVRCMPCISPGTGRFQPYYDRDLRKELLARFRNGLPAETVPYAGSVIILSKRCTPVGHQVRNRLSKIRGSGTAKSGARFPWKRRRARFRLSRMERELITRVVGGGTTKHGIAFICIYSPIFSITGPVRRRSRRVGDILNISFIP